MITAIDPKPKAIVVMHDNPDPDAIAAGWGLRVLIEERLKIPVSLLGGGAIVRAENCHMVNLLSPPLELVNEIPFDEETAIVLVDCGMGSSNHAVTRQGITPVAVVDHHLGGDAVVPFMDVRPDAAASATIAADYLREQGIEPGVKLATAMLYAIRTETRAFEYHHSDLDRSIVLWLTQWADPALLAEIESAPLSLEYFADLALALQSTEVFNDTAFCLLPRAEGAEVVGEFADMLVRCRTIQRVFSGAIINGDLLVSVRTKREGDCAAKLVQQALDGLGSGGGHDHRAGGKIVNAGVQSTVGDRWKAELRQRWLTACGFARPEGEPLISRHEIIKHL